MTTKKKMLQAAAGNAGNAGGGGLDIDEVFSTYLYESTGSAQTITNGIDLDGEGGLVWTKQRDGSAIHGLVDTERGRTVYLDTNSVRANRTTNGPTYDLTSFNSDGFSLGQNWELYGNNNGNTYASWTFRKAPKFFDVVTYSGNGTAGRTVSHNLGSVPGMIIIKDLTFANNWVVYHRGSNGGVDPEDYWLSLNSTAAQVNHAGYFNDTAPTATEFTVGANSRVNNDSATYVAYIFAHNDGDGDFGPDADQDIIKCGSYTGNGSATGPSVNLGFEPQWLLIRNVDRADDWVLIDAMRGIPSSSDGPAVLRPESSAAEYASGSTFSQASRVDLTATGFDVKSSNSRVNGSNQNIIYIAIRRGPLAPPESATDVFKPVFGDGTPPAMESGFVVDAAIVRNPNVSTNNHLVSRVTGGANLITNSYESEGTFLGGQLGWDYNTGFMKTYGSSVWSAMWKRAPNFMDVVAYTGNSTAGRTVSHNLGVAPEMMWVKKRNAAGLWRVYHKSLNGGTNPEQYGINLNETSAEYDLNTLWNDTAPTSSVFTLGTQGNVNGSSSTYIAYLFASLDGISKVGSVSHTTGSNTDVDCGFSAGARFVILKGADLATGWLMFDSTRGIISGNSPTLNLSSTSAEDSSQDRLDPYSSGFSVGPDIATGTWIYYAIA